MLSLWSDACVRPVERRSLRLRVPPMIRRLPSGGIRLDVTVEAVAVPDGHISLSVDSPAQIRPGSGPAQRTLPAGTYTRTFSWEIDPPLSPELAPTAAVYATVRAVAG